MQCCFLSHIFKSHILQNEQKYTATALFLLDWQSQCSSGNPRTIRDNLPIAIQTRSSVTMCVCIFECTTCGWYQFGQTHIPTQHVAATLVYAVTMHSWVHGFQCSTTQLEYESPAVRPEFWILAHLSSEFPDLSSHVSCFLLVLGNLSAIFLNVSTLSAELASYVVLDNSKLQSGVLGKDGEDHQWRKKIAGLNVTQHCTNLQQTCIHAVPVQTPVPPNCLPPLHFKDNLPPPQINHAPPQPPSPFTPPPFDAH